jgi:hypothetical protein
MNILQSNEDIAHEEEEGESEEDEFEVQRNNYNFTLRYSAAYSLGMLSKSLPAETFNQLMPHFQQAF